MSILYRKEGAFLVIFGQTFPAKDEIKALGARFDGVGKNWRVPFSDDLLAKVDALCRSRGGGPIEDKNEVVLSPPSPLTAMDSSLVSTIVPSSSNSQAPATTPVMERYDQALDNYLKARPSSAVVTEDKSLAETAESQSVYSDALTVRQLLDRAQRVIHQSFTESFWIVGELQNLSSKASGIFFDLAEGRDSEPFNASLDRRLLRAASPQQAGSRRDTSATLTIRCVLWQEAMQKTKLLRGADAVTSALQDGLKVALRCRVQFYKDRAQLSLVVEDIDPSYTKGALALAREKLLAELRASGLDRANGQLDFPVFPFEVGLISAEGSRAYSDFCHQLESLGFPGRVWFCPAPMQGDGVPAAVASALTRLSQRGCDVIVITRGGGSAADLRWFDDPVIAYAIARSPIPVIAAIGHHDDRCVAEEVCYLRQKTPTAAADFLAGCFTAARRRIDDAAHQLVRGLTRRRDGFAEETARLGEKIGLLATRALESRRSGWFQMQAEIQRRSALVVTPANRALEKHQNEIYMRANLKLSKSQEELSSLNELLIASDPRPWLAQGWTQLRGEGSGVISKVAMANVGQLVYARLLDGRVQLMVTGVEVKGN